MIVPRYRAAHCHVVGKAGDLELTGNPTAITRDIETLFGTVGWLSRQPSAFRAAILAERRIVHIKRGEVVYREGDAGGSIYGVIDGGIGVLIGPPRLSPRLCHIVRAGAWFGIGPVLSGGNRTMELRASEPSTLLTVSAATIAAINHDDPETIRRIGGLSSEILDVAARIAAELLIPQSNRRIAAVLLRVVAADALVDPGRPLRALLSQNQLAEMSNVSRNLVNIALRQFKAAGWVETQYNHVNIIAAPALAHFAYAED